MSSSASSRRYNRPADAGGARRASRSSLAGQVDYQGVKLEEMDTDAVIARRPQVALD